MLYSSKMSFDALFSHNHLTSLGIRQFRDHALILRRGNQGLGRCAHVCAAVRLDVTRGGTSAPAQKAMLPSSSPPLLPRRITITSSVLLHHSCMEFKEWILIQSSSACTKEHQLVLDIKR